MKVHARITVRASLLIAVAGALAWLTGNPFIFPSLGPTAYLLAMDGSGEYTARTVIGGHACGVIGGLIGYLIFVRPTGLLMLAEPVSVMGLHLALSAVASVAITTFLMLRFRASHAPACATTLIISLGILPGWLDAGMMLAAVALLFWVYLGLQRCTGVYA